MADYDRKQNTHRGGYNNRKRRYNGTIISLSQVSTAHKPAEEEDHDRRSQRRRYEEPPHLKLRRQMLAIAESVCVSLPGSSPAANSCVAAEEDRRGNQKHCAYSDNGLR